ncbi:MAG: hypothetical protein K0S54_174 [Alphaproteobacteria bacterium]|jgi:hypothetical protein|nr:hypothetical protein [Alphaproteobacteria bacterium]
MDRIQYLANLSVRRGCGFAALAIFTTMFGMAGEPALAIRMGAGMFALAGLVLAFKAWHATRSDYRQTEVWIMLDKGRDLPPGYPPEIICQILRDVYLRHAELAGAIALAMGLVVVVLMIIG